MSVAQIRAPVDKGEIRGTLRKQPGFNRRLQ